MNTQIYGEPRNFQVIGLLRHLNGVVGERCPGAIMIAEQLTAWPGVSRPISSGGLGFSYKWNMGWMHDTLNYITKDPIHREYHHHDMTFACSMRLVKTLFCRSHTMKSSMENDR